jgi:PAS domain S-box-containing protein
MADQGWADRAAREGEMFRLFVENVVDYAIFIVDADGLVQTWSHGALRILSYREDEILGRSATSSTPPRTCKTTFPAGRCGRR